MFGEELWVTGFLRYCEFDGIFILVAGYGFWGDIVAEFIQSLITLHQILMESLPFVAKVHWIAFTQQIMLQFIFIVIAEYRQREQKE